MINQCLWPDSVDTRQSSLLPWDWDEQSRLFYWLYNCSAGGSVTQERHKALYRVHTILRSDQAVVRSSAPLNSWSNVYNVVAPGGRQLVSVVSSSELVAGRGQFCTAGRAGGVGLQRHYAAPGLAAGSWPGRAAASPQCSSSFLCCAGGSQIKLPWKFRKILTILGEGPEPSQ